MNNTSFLCLALCVLTIVLGFLSQEILKTDQLVINSLAERLTNDQIQDALNFKQKWQWINYVLLPLLLLIKISCIAAILDIGCFLFSQEIKYSRLFTAVVKAEFVFLLVFVLKTAWFYFFQQHYTLEDLQYFYPFSALSIIGYEDLQPWFIYPLQVANLFEVAYCLILAYLIGRELHVTTQKGLSIVASSYGTGLLIWVVGVMFFTLNMS